MQQIYLLSNFKKKELINLAKISALVNHPQRDIIKYRLKVIDTFDDYGYKAVKDIFGVSRSTVYLWKKKLKESGGDIKVLAPLSRAPNRRRKREVHPLIESFIIKYRQEHYRAGKQTIKPELDEYCKANNLKPISESTIGRIIADLKKRGKLTEGNRVRFNARTGRISIVKRKVRKKLRRKDYIPERPGDLVQIDTLDIFSEGIKRYIINGIDVKTKFAFSMMYDRLNSLNARDFLEKFRKVCPFEIRRIQTDNGSEFEKYFSKYTASENLTHYYNYPRHPQSNGCIERFNRTIKEQFVYSNFDRIEDVGEFNKAMMEYLVWYNTVKPHSGLNKNSPLKYYLDNFVNSPKKSKMLWTSTLP